MTPKWKWLIGLSLVLNLFLIAVIGGAAFIISRHLHDFRPPMGAGQQWKDADQHLSPESRKRIHAVIRQAALAGEPDLGKARDIRAQAAQLAAAQPYDAAKVAAMSEDARGYENQARAKVENALIQAMATLDSNERSAIANRMLRASFRFRFMTKGDHDGPRSPAGDAASSAAPNFVSD